MLFKIFLFSLFNDVLVRTFFWTVFDAVHECLKGTWITAWNLRKWEHQDLARGTWPMCCLTNYSVSYMFPKHRFLQTEINFHQDKWLYCKWFKDFIEGMLDICSEIWSYACYGLYMFALFLFGWLWISFYFFLSRIWVGWCWK